MPSIFSSPSVSVSILAFLIAGCGVFNKNNPPIESWNRRYFESGGGDAFLFYVVYGRVDMSAPLSRSKYRSGGIPQGLDVMAYGPSSGPEVPASFREGYVWEQFQASNPELADTVARQDSCTVLRGSFPDPQDLNYLRDTVGLVTHFLDHGAVAVYDPQMFQWWDPKEWRERIFDPAGPVPHNHTVILVSEEPDGTEWIHTRGLRKFGRPDISVRGVSDSQKDAFIEMCNRFIELQALGEIIPEGHEIRMPSLPEGLICRHGGDLEDPDFNNVHVRVALERASEEDG